MYIYIYIYIYIYMDMYIQDMQNIQDMYIYINTHLCGTELYSFFNFLPNVTIYESKIQALKKSISCFIYIKLFSILCFTIIFYTYIVYILYNICTLTFFKQHKSIQKCIFIFISIYIYIYISICIMYMYIYIYTQKKLPKWLPNICSTKICVFQ